MNQAYTTIIDLIEQLEEILLDGSQIPFTGARLVNEQETLEVLDAIREELPEQLLQAHKLLRQQKEFIKESSRKADKLLVQAKLDRDKMISSAAIKQEADRQIYELKLQTKEQCEQMLIDTRNERKLMQKKIKTEEAKLQEEYQRKKNLLENEFRKCTKEVDTKLLNKKNRLIEENQLLKANALKEMEYIKNESARIHTENQKQREEIKKEIEQYKSQVQIKCNSLLLKARQEATDIQVGANKYAEQTLLGLDLRLQEISKVISTGKKELAKLTSMKKSLYNIERPDKDSGNNNFDKQSFEHRKHG